MTEQQLIRFFRVMNKVMLWMWRIGMGRMINFWPAVTGRIMVITTTGRKSGLKRQTPLNYAIVDGELYCMAGIGDHAQWRQNAMLRPEVDVWLPDGKWRGCAEDVTDGPDSIRYFRAVVVASGFAAPVFGGFFPSRLDDTQLAEALKGSRLIHIQRI